MNSRNAALSSLFGAKMELKFTFFANLDYRCLNELGFITTCGETR